MAALTNPQHEEFAQLLAAGTPPPDAYAQTHPGTSDETAQSEAEHLTQTPEIEQRLTELLEGSAEEAIWTLAQRLEYLRAIALTAPSEIDAQSPICARVKHTAHGVEYRLPNKLAAVASTKNWLRIWSPPTAPNEISWPK